MNLLSKTNFLPLHFLQAASFIVYFCLIILNNINNKWGVCGSFISPNDLKPPSPNDLSIEHCEIYPSTASLDSSPALKCIRCSSGFVLSYDAKRCTTISEELSNCVQIGYFGECIVCECGYSALNNGLHICVRTPPSLHGCQIFDDNDNCLKPKTEFQLILETTFVTPFSKSVQFAAGSHCEIKSNQDICLRCHHGYILETGSMLSIQPSCTQSKIEIANSYYSYFEGNTLKSRDLRFIVVGNGVFPAIENCLNHVLKDKTKYQLASNKNINYTRQTSLQNNDIECIECLNGRIPNESRNMCKKIPIQLCGEVSDENSQVCTKCADNNRYYLFQLPNNQLHCIPRTLSKYDGCLKYAPNSDFCEECRRPFLLKEGTCVFMESKDNQFNLAITDPLKSPGLIPNCAIYVSKHTCLECEKKYTLTSEGKCQIEFDENCKLANPNGECIYCINGMEPNDKLTQCIRSHLATCFDFDRTHSECLICNHGFYLSSDKSTCIPLFNCLFSNGIDHTCLLCKSMFYLKKLNTGNQVCMSITSREDCYFSDGITDECIVCKRLFKKNPYNSKLCDPFVTHSNGVCDVYGFFVESNEQLYCKRHSVSAKQDCFMLDPSRDGCLRCESSFYLEKETGICRRIIHCQCSEGYEKKCLQGDNQNGYFTADGEFQIQNDLCFTNQIDPICLRFDQNSQPILSVYLKDGVPVKEFSLSDFPPRVAKNCLVIEMKGTRNTSYEDIIQCKQCSSLFFPNEVGVCEEINIPNCSFSNGRENRCSLCHSQDTIHQVDKATGQCVFMNIKVSHCLEMGEEGVCKRCEPLFVLGFGGLMCLSFENPFCKMISRSLDSCHCKLNGQTEDCQQVNCEEILIDKVFSCKKCITGTVLFRHSGDNVMCEQNTQFYCKIVSEDFFCVECMEGYFKSPLKESQQICQKITMPNCLAMEDFTFQCKLCESGYFLTKKGYCITIEHCIEFDSICRGCSPPYVVNAFGLCEIIPNCTQMNSKECLQCEQSYYVSDTKKECLKIDNCISSQGFSYKCEVCLPSFKLVAHICIPEIRIEHCIEYTDSGSCSKCSQLNYLIKHENNTNIMICTSISNIQNCNSSDGISNVCSSCESFGGFYLDTTKNSCESIPYCFLSNGIDTCFICNKRYYLNNIPTQQRIDNTGSLIEQCKPQQPIDRCVFYDSAQEGCEECQEYYYVSADRLSCIQIDFKRSNCHFSNGKTNQCMLYHDLRFSERLEYEKKRYPRSRFFENFVEPFQSNRILRIHSLCSMNHFQQSGVCIQRSPKRGDSCAIYYYDRNGCQICQSGYLLMESQILPYGSVCVPIPRVDQVAHCVSYAPNSNICIECEQRDDIEILEFILDSQSNRCVFVLEKKCDRSILKEIINRVQFFSVLQACSIYQAEQNTKSHQLCKKYNPICEGCLEMKCIECIEGYFLEQGKCNKHSEIRSQCKIMSQLIKNACEVCESGYALEQEICIEKSTKQERNECKPGFFLSETFGCLEVNSVCAISHCFKYAGITSLPDSYECQECDLGYFLDEYFSCSKEIPQANRTSDEQKEDRSSSNKSNSGSRNEQSNSTNEEEEGYIYFLKVFVILVACAGILGIIILFYCKLKKHKRLFKHFENEHNQDNTIFQLTTISARLPLDLSNEI